MPPKEEADRKKADLKSVYVPRETGEANFEIEESCNLRFNIQHRAQQKEPKDSPIPFFKRIF